MASTGWQSCRCRCGGSGRSCDVRCVEDLKKQEHPEAKKRKKYSNKEMPVYPPSPCRRVSSYTHCAAPCIGV
ncbi:hypothetical protein CCACVL1_16797 [Corchorus capsularis]|uniref:Uncharacterized protein n=1 Tax=Corchorus capsularis TaxID=210143 RepID=A0A1R3HVI9_COCAP|nr:hypothetical protein CCACVL1_16797 [Corchorus capsularis]